MRSTRSFLLALGALLALAPRAARADDGRPELWFTAVTGTQHGVVHIEARLTSNGGRVVETSNTFTVPKPLRTGAGNCAGNTWIGKSMLVSLVAETQNATTIRVHLFPYENENPIPDDYLYRCAIDIRPITPVGTYRIAVGRLSLHDPDGRELAARGGDGLVIVQPGAIDPGDLNGDGVVDETDRDELVVLLFRDYAGGAADANGDDVVTAADVIAVGRRRSPRPSGID
jgi:hypothetical protein